MSDLLDLYKFYGAKFPEGLKTSQDAQANAIALDNARRAQQERMDLKALYAQQAQPSMAQLGAVSPEYAQAARKNELEMQQAIIGMQHQQAQTGDIQRKANEDQSKLRAQAVVPIVDKYNEMRASGMPKEQADQWFHSTSGQAIAGLQQQGLIPENFSYDANNISPEMAERTAAGLGYPSQKFQAMLKSSQTTAEQQARVNVGPVMTPEQGYGSVEIDPNTGLAFKKPALSAPIQHEISVAPGEVNPIADYEAIVNSPTAPKELKDFAAQQIEIMVEKAPSPFATPAQLQAKRVEQKANEESAIKTAQIEATEKAADKKAIETYFRGPKPEAIRNLIKESIEGDVQSGIARLGKFFGVAVPGGDALAALKVIQQQMARSLPYAPGGASDIDVRNRLEMISNPATDEPIANRLRAMDEVFRDAEAYVVQKGDFLSEDQILDSIKNGYLSEASALEMINNRMLNKGNPIYAPTQGNKTSTGVK
jgi:hypothetical protein